MKKGNKMRLCNYICAFMCLLVLITQFLPFWDCTNCKTHKEVDKKISVAGYVWIPVNHKSITNDMTDVYLEEYGEDFKGEDGKKFKFVAKDIAGPCAFIFLGSIAGIVLAFVFTKRMFAQLLALSAGSWGIYWYLICPAMKVGANWKLHLAAMALAALAGLAAVVVNVLAATKKK